MLILAAVEKPGENLDLPHDEIEGKFLDTTLQLLSKVLHLISAVHKGQRSTRSRRNGTERSAVVPFRVLVRPVVGGFK